MNIKDVLFTIAVIGFIGALVLTGKGLHMTFYISALDQLLGGDRTGNPTLQLNALRGLALICGGAVCALITVASLVAATLATETDVKAATEAATQSSTL